jgi:NSS family neurotransmitter:Na+ symporter
MPALFILLLILLGYAASTPAFLEGAKFMFVPDFSEVRGASILNAMGMAFFSLSLGMGAIMMYGSYLPKNASIANLAVTVAAADTIVALIAGLIIFPLVFSYGLNPAEGADLVFKTLPLAFNQMPAGTVIGTLFFVLLALAAITSAISLLEPPVAWIVENKKIDRAQAARLSGAIAWLLGLGTIFSFNLWADYKWTFRFDLGKVQYVLFRDKSFFNVVDFLTSNVMLPLGGLLIAMFVAHLMRRESCEDELSMNRHHFNVWYFILRNISPIAVAIVFLHAIGFFELLGISV